MTSQQRRRRLEIENIGNVAVVNFVDRKILDNQNIEVIGKELLALSDDNPRILVNFGNVEYLSTAALGKLIRLSRKVIAAGGELVLCNMDPQIYEIFEITMLDRKMLGNKKLFTFVKEENEGLKLFTVGTVAMKPIHTAQTAEPFYQI